MWFFNQAPSKVEATFLVEALDHGYQEVNLQLLIEKREKIVANVSDEKSEEKEVEVVIPFPWAANKPDGAFKLSNNDKLKLLQDESLISVPINDVKIYKTVREVKKETDRKIDYVVIREIWDTYNEEDFGVAVFKVEPGIRYQLNYIHKVSIFSTIFVPTKFSNYHSISKPETNFKIWTLNCTKAGLPNFVKSLNYDKCLMKIFKGKNLDCYGMKEDFDFGYDAKFGASNWDSSDDSFSEDSLASE